MSQTVKALLSLRQLILSGELTPHERLTELAMSERLGVSRTPLRHALTQLAHEGLLKALPGGGFSIREFTDAEIYDAIELRGVLEGTAARFAAERQPAKFLIVEARRLVQEIDGLIVRTEFGPAELEQYIATNENLHRTILRMANSDPLRLSLDRVLALPFASPSAFLRVQSERVDSKQVLVIAQEQHRSILEAIESGEGSRAEALAREHSRIARRNLQLAFRSGSIFGILPFSRRSYVASAGA